MSRDTVIVIKSVNYGEADKVLTVFGKNTGKFPLFAKGIRKIDSRNRGNMQTLTTSKVSFYEGKGIPLLTESEFVYAIDTDKMRIENVRRILFLLNKFLQDYDPYPKLFDSLQNSLRNNLDIRATNKFRIIFLKEMGFLGDFSSCIKCGTQKDLEYLSNKGFALLCKNCYSKSNGYPLGSDPYASVNLTKRLDEYVKKVVDEI
ncbi:MAG TPA: DNA repair protein RecO [Candidatus Dojkabacteria bacterium]|jgi:DNA repair protein RecO (recombination protein O)|nr:DNA repair protein RecO [Candidatus Dojkabacteria bacterium]